MHTFALHSPLAGWKSGDYALSPFVHLSLGSYSQDKSHILLSAQLMTEKEIDDEVSRLASELEEFRIVAKRSLKDILNRQLTK